MPRRKTPRCFGSGCCAPSSMPPIMPRMSDARPWLDHYPPDVPASLAPYPDESLFSLLQNAAAGFGSRTAIAFFGRHLTYAAAPGRGGALLRGPRGARRAQGRSRGPPAAELPRVRDRVLRVPADRRDRGGQQPALHGARARAPAQGRRHLGDGRARPGVREVRQGPRRRRRARGDRREAEPLHGVPAQRARAAEVQARGEEGGALAVRPAGPPDPLVGRRDEGRGTGPAGGAGGSRRRRRGLPLHGRHDRAVEGRDAQPPQPRGERDAGERLALRGASAARAGSGRACRSSTRSARSP